MRAFLRLLDAFIHTCDLAIRRHFGLDDDWTVTK